MGAQPRMKSGARGRRRWLGGYPFRFLLQPPPLILYCRTCRQPGTAQRPASRVWMQVWRASGKAGASVGCGCRYNEE